MQMYNSKKREDWLTPGKKFRHYLIYILLQTAISLTYRDYTSSPVRFLNYMMFLVYTIEKIIEGNLKSAHTPNQKVFNGDGGKAKKKRKISQ